MAKYVRQLVKPRRKPEPPSRQEMTNPRVVFCEGRLLGVGLWGKAEALFGVRWFRHMPETHVDLTKLFVSRLESEQLEARWNVGINCVLGPFGLESRYTT